MHTSCVLTCIALRQFIQNEQAGKCTLTCLKLYIAPLYVTVCYKTTVTVLHWGVIQNKRHHKALTHVTCVATTWGCECLAVLKGLQLNRHWVLCKCSTLWCGRIGFVSKGKHFGLAGSQACILFWVRVSDSGRPG